MNFEIILACDQSYGIGNHGIKNTLPWKIKEDMAYFNKTTTQVPENSNTKNVIIMGRATADTFPKALPKRLNVVITSNPKYREGQGFLTYRSLDHALDALKVMENTEKNINKVFVIGGAKLVDQAVKHRRCRVIHLTEIPHDYNCEIKLTPNFINQITEYGSFEKTSSIVVKSTCNTLKREIDITFNQYRYINREESKILDLYEKVLTHGKLQKKRNGMAYEVVGGMLEFDMKNGLPCMTTKRVFHRGASEELLFFFRGETNTKILEAKHVDIWKDNTSEEFIKKNGKRLREGDMGPMYGYQWRHFDAPYPNTPDDWKESDLKKCGYSSECRYVIGQCKNVHNSCCPVCDPKCPEYDPSLPSIFYDGDYSDASWHKNESDTEDNGSDKGGFDQFKKLIDQMIQDPFSRRYLMTTYNPKQVDQGVLYPCHGLIIQFEIEDDNKITLLMYQRSVDLILGLPFNIIEYAEMLHIVVNMLNNHPMRTHKTDYIPHRLIMYFGNIHIYDRPDHLEVAKTQIARRWETYPFPDFVIDTKISSFKVLEKLKSSNLKINNYISGSKLQAKMVA